MKTARLVALMLAVSTVDSAFSITISSGPVLPGEWNSNFSSAKAMAEANHVPMLVFWGRSQCTYCQNLSAAVDESDFRNWQSTRGYVMVACQEGRHAEEAVCHDFARNSKRFLPCIAVYWVREDGQVFKSTFPGRPGEMPVQSGAVQQQLMASVDTLVEGWRGAPVPAEQPSGSVITQAKTYAAAIRTADGLVGTLTLKIGKGSRKGMSSVSGSITDVKGKRYSIRSTKIRTSSWPLSGSLEVRNYGALGFSLTADGLTGTIGELIVTSVDSLGKLPDGEHRARLAVAPEMLADDIVKDLLPDQKFEVQGNRWTFPRAPKISYKDGRLLVSDPTGMKTNVSNLKLSAQPARGLLKGSFKVYSIVNGRLKSKTAKVSGLLAGTLCTATVEINGVACPLEIK